MVWKGGALLMPWCHFQVSTWKWCHNIHDALEKLPNLCGKNHTDFGKFLEHHMLCDINSGQSVGSHVLGLCHHSSSPFILPLLQWVSVGDRAQRQEVAIIGQMLTLILLHRLVLSSGLIGLWGKPTGDWVGQEHGGQPSVLDDVISGKWCDHF